MTRSPITPKDPVACAAVEALLAARWKFAELLSRRPSLPAADLLRGHAAELATSALASDQILSLALEAAVRDIEAEIPALERDALLLFDDGGCAAGARQCIRNMVLQQPAEPSSADLAAEIERRRPKQETPCRCALAIRTTPAAESLGFFRLALGIPARRGLLTVGLLLVTVVAFAAQAYPMRSDQHARLRRPRIPHKRRRS